MRKFFLVFLVILFLAQVIYADNNGIWIDAKDIRTGTFGSDESEGDFIFPNNLDVSERLTTNRIISTTASITSLLEADNFQTNSINVSGNAGSLKLIGVDHSYLEFYPQGSSTRKGWIGFGSDGTEVLSVQSENDALVLNPYGNNVGIGVSNPTQQLDVNGNARIRNNIYTSGAIYENGNRVAIKSEVYTKSEVDSMIADAVAAATPSSCSATTKNDYICSFSFPATSHGEVVTARSGSSGSRWTGTMQAQCNDGTLQVMSSSCRNG